jgi:hypothetical protein
MVALMSKDPTCRKYVSHFAGTVVAGALPSSCKQLLLSDMLLAMTKPNGSVRPLAMGEVLIRFCSACAMSLVPDEAYHDFFLPHQYGVKVSSGC